MPTRLAQHLVANSLIQRNAADAALRGRAIRGGSLDTVLLEDGVISEEGMLQALADVSGLRLVNLSDFEPNPKIASLIPKKIAEQHRIVPMSLEEDTLHVACSYPPPEDSLREIAILLHKKLVPWIALECRLREWISAIYDGTLEPRYVRLLETLDPRHRVTFSPPPASNDGQETPTTEADESESITVGMIEHLAQSVAEEPIPLESKKTTAPGEIDSAPSWTLADARQMLAESTKDRERVVDIALRFGQRTFEFTALLAIVRGTALGWEARGKGIETSSLRKVSIPLDAASVFRTVAFCRGSYIGPLPPDNLTKQYLESLGRSPRFAFLFPIEVNGRLVAIIYADNGQGSISYRRLADYILFCRDLPDAFHELAIYRRSSPTQPQVASGTVSRQTTPDFDSLLNHLIGPDVSQRTKVLAELGRTPQASARMLAKAFPGPTAWSRLPVVQLPEADELGPIPGALAKLGRDGAAALAPLLDVDDTNMRYFALLTAGSLPYSELFDGVMRSVFDLEPDLASAARAAAPSFRKLSDFETAKAMLRRELTSSDPLQISLAARALGTLHDLPSISRLIGLTGSRDSLCAEAAAEALREITRASFGTRPRDWAEWWIKNHDRPRVQWLLDGLRHSELDVRLAAIDELAQTFNGNLGYFADAPPNERDAALIRWEAALANRSELEL